MRASSFIIVIMVASLLGCDSKPKNKTFSGQIFITLENRETLKMSLVPVALILNGETFIDKYAALIETNQWKQIHLRKAELNFRTAQLNRDQAASARTSLRQSIWAREDENKRYAARKLTRNIEQNNKEIAAKKLELETVDQKAEDAEKALSNAREELESLRPDTSAEAEKSAIWRMVKNFATSTTDADGNFSVSTTGTNQWWIAAYAERAVADQSEEYLWIVKATGIEKIHLNNLNEISAITSK